jgi:hypothetical protein
MEWAYSESGQKIGDSSVLARHQNLNLLGRVTVLRHRHAEVPLVALSSGLLRRPVR